MRQAARVDDRPIEVAPLEPIDEDSLVVRLQAFDLEAQLGPASPEPLVDLSQRRVPVDLRLARSEQVQVRSVEDEHADHDWLVSKPLKIGAVRRAAARPTSTTSAGTPDRTATPTSVGRTQLRRPSACFLSVAMCSRTASSATPGCSTPRPSRSSKAFTRSALPAGTMPSAVAMASAPRSPYATASPWRIAEYPAAASMPWPMVWPRLRVMRRPVSRSSAVTTSTLAQAQRSTISASVPDS